MTDIINPMRELNDVGNLEYDPNRKITFFAKDWNDLKACIDSILEVVNGGIEPPPPDPSTLLNDLISFYPLNINANDSVGSNHGSAVNVVYATPSGDSEQAASFNGSNGYINLNNKLISSGSTVTVSCLIYSLSSSQGQDVTIFSNQGETNQYGMSFSRNTAIANRWGFFYGSGNGTGWAGYNANYFEISPNTWHHLVCTIDGNVVKVYLDGTQVATFTGTYNVNFANAQNFHLGQDPILSVGRYFNGYMKRFAIWPRVLSTEERDELHLLSGDLSSLL